MGVSQARAGIEDFSHRLSVIGPIGGQPPDTVGGESGGDQFGELGADQASLVVAGLVPRIGEERPQLTDRALVEDRGQCLGTVGHHQPDIAELVAGQLAQGRGHRRGEDLEGNQVRVGMSQGALGDRRTGARADLDDQRGAAAERGRPVDVGVVGHRGLPLTGGQLDHPLVVMGVPGLLLGGIHSRAAPDVADDIAMNPGHGRNHTAHRRRVLPCPMQPDAPARGIRLPRAASERGSVPFLLVSEEWTGGTGSPCRTHWVGCSSRGSAPEEALIPGAPPPESSFRIYQADELKYLNGFR